MQKAYSFLEYTDRNIRKEVFEKILVRNFQDKKALDDIYDQLIKLRHQVALNADYDNFRDYSFIAYDRFDYTPNDCLQFHESIKEVVVPIIDEIYSKRKQDLGYKQLKPYDLKVDTSSQLPLCPFIDEIDLINKTIRVFNRVDEKFGSLISKMNDNGFLDLDSRKNKVPGGFLVPLPVSKIPFIFMNATCTFSRCKYYGT